MSDVFVGDNDHGDTPLPPLSDLLWAEVTKLRQDKVRLEEDIVHFANELNEVTHQRDEARREVCEWATCKQLTKERDEARQEVCKRVESASCLSDGEPTTTASDYARWCGWDCFKEDCK